MVTSIPTARPTPYRQPQDRGNVAPAETIRQAVIDGGHDAVVEAIGIQMDEEAFHLRPGQSVECRLHRPLDAHLPDRGQVEGQDVGRQRLAAVLTLFVSVPESECHGVRRTDQGTTVFEVGQERRTVPGREGEIHGGSLAVWIRRRLVEVGVSIDEQQAEPTAPFEREHGAEKDRTIAAQNQRKFTCVKHAADRIGQPRTPVCDGTCVERTGRRVTLVAIWQRFDTPGVPRAQAFRQPVLEQRLR